MNRFSDQETSDAKTPPVFYKGRSYRQAKRFLVGMHRSRSPEETLSVIHPTFQKIGLTRLANITGLDRLGIPTALAIRPNSEYLSVDGGKGLTLEAAMVSAAMECIERYHVEKMSIGSFVRAPARVRQRYATIPSARLPLAKNPLFNPRLPQRWTLGWDIIQQAEVAVPAILLSLTGSQLDAKELASFQFSSNGLASGNNFLEAVLSALLELLERDAVACHTHRQRVTGQHIPKVHLESITYPLVEELLARCRQSGIKPIFYDCSLHRDIPVYMAYLYDQTTRHVGVFKGYGAHLDPEIAMLRALTEAAQSRLIYIAGGRDDFFKNNLLGLQVADNQRFIRHLEAQDSTVQPATNTTPFSPTFEQDIHTCCRKLEQWGLNRVVVFDLTQPDFDLAVVKVIVPGLEGYIFRDFYSPGPRARAFAEDEVLVQSDSGN
jgi:ribosomal protein S12 methylthiotransferase accessory factor